MSSTKYQIKNNQGIFFTVYFSELLRGPWRWGKNRWDEKLYDSAFAHQTFAFSCESVAFSRETLGLFAKTLNAKVLRDNSDTNIEMIYGDSLQRTF